MRIYRSSRFAILMISAATLAFGINLTRLFSVESWRMFAKGNGAYN